MITAPRYVPFGNDEIVNRLAIGLEIVDGYGFPLRDASVRAFAESGRLARTAVNRAGGTRLPQLPLHSPGRWSLLLGDRGFLDALPPGPGPAADLLRVRLVDATGRHVPRRIAFELPRLDLGPGPTSDLDTLDNSAARPLAWQASYRIAMLPSPSAPMPVGSSLLRGVVRDAAGVVPWARVTVVPVATPPSNRPLAWAHADHSGEFQIPLPVSAALMGTAATPARVTVRAFAPAPSLPAADVLTSLPVERMVPQTAAGALDDSAAGRPTSRFSRRSSPITVAVVPGSTVRLPVLLVVP